MQIIDTSNFGGVLISLGFILLAQVTDAPGWLKIIVLCIGGLAGLVTMFYTIYKWYMEYKDRKEKQKNS